MKDKRGEESGRKSSSVQMEKSPNNGINSSRRSKQDEGTPIYENINNSAYGTLRKQAVYTPIKDYKVRDLHEISLKKWQELVDPEVAELSTKTVVVQEREAENYLRLVFSPVGILSDLETKFRDGSPMGARSPVEQEMDKEYMSHNEIHKYCCPHHGCHYKLLSYNTPGDCSRQKSAPRIRSRSATGKISQIHSTFGIV